MAPEAQTLKRKRSRPSDWWAATPSTPQQQDEPPAKKRERPPSLGAEGKGIKDAPAAGNRGKSVKGKEVVRDGENAAAELLEKPFRRGKSSVAREELMGALGTSKTAGKGKGKTGRRIQKAGEDQSIPKKRGRNAASQVEEQAEAAMEKASPKKRERLSAVRFEESDKAIEPVKETNSLRRGRSSNTEAELRAVPKSEAQVPEAPKKRRRCPAVEREVPTSVEEADEDPIAPPQRRRRAQMLEAEAPLDELVDGSSARQKKTKKRRSGAEILAAEALSLTTTEDYAKGRTRLLVANPSAPSNDDQERGRKRTRRSDSQLEGVQPTASLQVEHQERGRARTTISGVDLREETVAESSKQSNRSRQRDQRIEVKTASSKLVRSRSGPKKGITLAVEKRTKPGRGSTAADQSPKNKKYTKSSITEDVASAVPESAQSRKRVSKHQSQDDAKVRKRKSVEKHPESEPVNRRRIEKPQQDEDSPEAEEAPVYQHLQAITHRVSRQTIDAKWEPLPSVCVERISQLLQDLQRPVVVRYNDERKKTQSSTALKVISRRLISKISKGLPFPQRTRNHREDDFDFENILDHNRALESQLTPALHANELLEAELSKETAFLESEREILANLETNSKTETALRSEAARKLHSLLQPQNRTAEIEGLKDDVGLLIDQAPLSLGLTIQDDEHLHAFVKELNGHVDSIQANIRQVQGVVQAISKSKAAVQATLFGHLHTAQYEEVVLGAE